MAHDDTTKRSHRDCMDALAALESCLDVDTTTVEWAGRFEPCIDRLSTTLRRQFELEERGALYVELPTREPRLAERIEACRAEHAELIAGVDTVVADLRRAVDDAARRRVAARTSTLVEHVRRHESSEAELMQSAVLREMGAGD